MYVATGMIVHLEARAIILCPAFRSVMGIRLTCWTRSHVCRLRSLGSAALNACMVATGGVDAYYEYGVVSLRLVALFVDLGI